MALTSWVDISNIKSIVDQNNEPPKIVFEGNEFRRPSHLYQTQPPKIIQWVITYSGGLIKDEKQANYVLIGFVVISIIITLMVIFGNNSQELPPERVMSEFL